MNNIRQINPIKQKPYYFNVSAIKPSTKLATVPKTSNGLGTNDIMGIASSAGTILDTAIQNASIADTDNIEGNIDSAFNYSVGSNTNDSLLDEWLNYKFLDDVSYSDIRGGSDSQRALSTLGATGSGALTGLTVGGPIGAIVGGVVGLGSSIGGWIAGNAKAKRKTRELNNQISRANSYVQNSFINAARNIDELNDMRILSNYSAYGGPINIRTLSPMSPFGNTFKSGGKIHIKPSKRGTFTAAAAKRHGKSVQEFASQVLANKENYSPAMVKKANFARNASKWKHADGGPLYTHGGIFSNGVTQINSGGLHSTNPFEGVQIGVDEQGIPNLVEEGEVIFNNYVFSNRMKAPKNMKKQYKFKGNTFADVAKNIQKESEERPNDPISQAGLEANMARLAISQEGIRNKGNKRGGKNKFAVGGILPYMRYAPAIGAGINTLTDALGITNQYDYSNIDLIGDVADNLSTVSYSPIGNYLTYKPLDREYYLNKLNAQSGATRRSIENLSGGNRATKMANLLAADYNAQAKMGDLIRQSEEYNDAQRQRVEEFNRGTNMFNSQSALKASQINKQNDELRLKAAITEAQLREQVDSLISSSRSSNLTNFLESLGDIGREDFIMNQIKSNPALLYTYSDALGNVGYKKKKKSKGGFLTIKRK